MYHIILFDLDGTRSNKADVIENVLRQLEVTPEKKLETIMIELF